MKWLLAVLLLGVAVNASEEKISMLTEEARQLSKSELHLHLGGSWPLSYLKTIATVEQMEQLTAALKKIEQEEPNYHETFSAFVLVGKIVNSSEKVEQGVVALCKELTEDGVTYVEIRTGLKDFGDGIEGYLNAVLRGFATGRALYGIDGGIVLSLRRDSSKDLAESTVELALAYRNNGVVGLDLSGDSTIGDGTNVFAALQKGQSEGLSLSLHLGESPKESATQQMLELTLLDPIRIGHGVHLSKEAKEWIFKRKLPLELCLTSAVRAGMIKQAEDHPGIFLLKTGYPVVICTDDPLIFNTTLSKEYAQVSLITGISLEKLTRLQCIH